MGILVDICLSGLRVREEDDRLFYFYSPDLLGARERLLTFRKTIDERISHIESELDYIKKTWDSEDDSIWTPRQKGAHQVGTKSLQELKQPSVP